MPMSEAAMDGIRDNGHRWKHAIRLGQAPQLLGMQNDADEPDDAEVERLALRIAQSVRRYCDQHDWTVETALLDRAEELEEAADCGLDEVNWAMGRLYDCFDYHRILVQRPNLPPPNRPAL